MPMASKIYDQKISFCAEIALKEGFASDSELDFLDRIDKLVFFSSKDLRELATSLGMDHNYWRKEVGGESTWILRRYKHYLDQKMAVCSIIIQSNGLPPTKEEKLRLMKLPMSELLSLAPSLGAPNTDSKTEVATMVSSPEGENATCENPDEVTKEGPLTQILGSLAKGAGMAMIHQAGKAVAHAVGVPEALPPLLLSTSGTKVAETAIQAQVFEAISPVLAGLRKS